MTHRSIRLLVIPAMVALLGLLLAACNEETTPSSSPTPTVSATASPSILSPSPQPSPSPSPSPASGIIEGSVLTPATVGSWTVIVDEFEFDHSTDAVTLPAGTRQLKVEVDLTNESDRSLSVRSSDWDLLGEEGRYQVLPTRDPDDQGERTFRAGERDDVSMSFAVPSGEGEYILRFTPSQGGPGTLRVPLR